jgi:biotin carboxyl carrier protein
MLRLVLASALAAAVVPRPAHAQTAPGKEHARRLFEEGVELEKKGDYAGALARYRDAEKIIATPGLRFHKGYCLEMTGKLAAAVDDYESADKLAREQNKPEVHTAVIARLDPLRPRVPLLAIRLATPKDAEVQLDGLVVGAPLLDGKPFRVDPGEHVVAASARGFRTFTRSLELTEGATATVDVTLERVTAAPAVAPPPVSPAPVTATPAEPPQPPSSAAEPPREPARGRSLVAPVVATVGTVLVAASGVAFFLVAGGAESDARAQCPQKPSCDSEQSRVRTFDALALGSFVGAAGLGVLSVVLWTSSSRGHAATSARVVATPTVLGIEGRF